MRVSLPTASAANTAVGSCRTSMIGIAGSALTAASYIGNTWAPDRVNMRLDAVGAGHVDGVDAAVAFSVGSRRHVTHATGRWARRRDQENGRARVVAGRATALGADLVEHGQQQIGTVRRLLGEQLGVGAQVVPALDPERELQVKGPQE